MDNRTDEVWKSATLATTFLEGIRGAIPLAQEQIDVMLRLMAACERSMRRVLDLGCGDGVLAAAVLDRFPEARAVLADFSEPMLDAARKRFARRLDRVELLTVDYGTPAWQQKVTGGGLFDAVVSGFSIHHQPDVRKREIYAEIYSVLAPGGMFVNVEHVAAGSEWISKVHTDLFVDALHRWQPAKSREEVAKTYHDRSDKSSNLLAPVDVQCEWLRGIGFTDVDCYFRVFELAVFGGRRPTSGTTSGTR